MAEWLTPADDIVALPIDELGLLVRPGSRSCGFSAGSERVSQIARLGQPSHLGVDLRFCWWAVRDLNL